MSDELQKQLAILKANYLISLPSKIDEIRDLWVMCREEESGNVSAGNEKTVDLHRKAHSLAGSGATFDQAELSKTAKTLEIFLKEHIESGDLFHENNINEVNSYIEKLDSSYDENSRVEKPEKNEENIKNTQLIDESVQKELMSNSEFGSAPFSMVVDKMKILIADDDLDNRKRLELILSSAGHEIFVASNGQEAVEQSLKHRPELILMDVVMPVMTGYDAARKIKYELADKFVPILFLTAVSDNESLAGCISSGGDDFITKPVHPLILNAKLAAFQRISQMYKKLGEYQKKNEEEMEASKEVFESLIYVNDPVINGLQTWAKSPGHFSGDTHLYTEMDNGHIYVLLCDFTGHGLPAAIGTVFVSDLFRSMTSKNIPAEYILDEINAKMNQILPTGRYCAAIMLDYSPSENKLMLWNSGLPEAYVTNAERQITAVYPSESVPLGVLPGKMSAKPYEINTAEINEIVIFSDGITEAEDPKGHMYGDEKLRQLIENSEKERDLFSVIKTDLETFMNGEEPTDDISLIVYKFK